ncbi:hypothetical protein Thimo_0785 [Thioflavicoccus mobilis 8321]|uniref:Uncharacterized protein n=1 Tax=Thioflavicoccus mobilis 8321 TaxID=765912 RepID=L0GWE9_9GAMM|nr:hypothetical protein [Thioflavicoccus mobilis]AGA89624.1 hypothetical protein Thimo_0785 [Thioflavicoccus mobilis 8321]
MTRLVLHIDRLVLRGVDPGDAEALAAGLRAGLARQLAEPGAAQALGGTASRPVVRADQVRLAPGDAAPAQGEAIAAHLVRETLR